MEKPMQLPAESALALVPPPSLQFLSCCVLGYAGRCATFGEGALEEHAASSIKVRAHACGSVAQVPPPRRRRSESILSRGAACLTCLVPRSLAGGGRTCAAYPTCGSIQAPVVGAAYPACAATLTRQQGRPAATTCLLELQALVQGRCASERPRAPPIVPPP